MADLLSRVRQRPVRASVVAFVLGTAFVVFAQKAWGLATACRESYQLLNPNNLCNRTVDEWDILPLRTAVAQRIAREQEMGNVTHMSVYFRDLLSGPRFGIEEYQDFHAASLLKVPVMIALLHLADKDPGLLDERRTTPAVLPLSSNTEEASETIQPHTSYTIRELLRKMIVFSDNHSAGLLVDEINAQAMPADSNAFIDLGMLKMMDGTMDMLSFQSYANLFKVLYNGAYLSHAHSQLGLELLLQSTYRDGLVAGVPATIRVAHKFGYHVISKEETQLHDCGIVYYPSHPYILCIMTSGANTRDEASAIAAVSRIVYTGLDALWR